MSDHVFIERLHDAFKESGYAPVSLDGLSHKEIFIAEKINRMVEKKRRDKSISEVYLQALNGTEHFYEMSIRALSALIKVGRLSEDVNNIESLCENTLDIFSHELDFENCSIMLKDKDEKYLTVIAGRGKGDKYLLQRRGKRGNRIKIGEGIAGKVAQTGEYIFIPDVKKDKRFQQMDMKVNVTSLLTIPLKSEEKVIGVINFSHPLLEAFDENKVNLMILLSNFVGQMVTLTKLHNRIARWNEILRSLAAEAAEKERLIVALRSIGDGVITTDTEDKIVFINKIAEGLTGWNQEEALGKSLAQVFHIVNTKTRKRCHDHVAKVLTTGDIVNLENNTLLIARDGTDQYVAANSAPILNKEKKIIGVIIVFRDITRHKEIEEEFLIKQKLESIGVLAGGIAHDFNNLLTGIMGNISLAKIFANPEDKIYGKLVEAEKASLRARDLTQKLLAFASGGVPARKTISLGELVKDSANFVLRGSNVKCESSIPDDLWPVEVDVEQISQAIHNLFINAREAMQLGGTINVCAKNKAAGAIHELPLQKGKYVKISIKDHGCGIPEEHIPNVFDPYFTTKEMGNQKGSGLGLAICHSIIEKHGGSISVKSERGLGTTFNIHLPAVENTS